MEKAVEMGKTSAAGSFRLLIGVAASTIIMAVETVILTNLLTRDDYGLYGIALVPSVLINLFRDWGVNSAMTKYIASSRVSNSEKDIHDFIVAGLIFEVVSGIALSFFSLFMANIIASTFFHRPESASYIAILSVSIISGSLLAACQGGFVGFERMGLNSLTLICQAVVKTAVALALVYLGYSVLGAVVGYAVGFVAAGVIGIATFYFILLRPLRKKLVKDSNAHTTGSISKTLKIMLNYGVPASIGSGLTGVLAQTYAFMIIPLTSNGMYADFSISTYFATLLTFFTIPIGTVLFPAFAKLDPSNEHNLVSSVFKSSVKYACILVLPATMVLMALSGPIVGTLFGEKYVYASFFLTISVTGTLFAALGNLSIIGFLSGLGETRMLMKQSIVTIIFGIPLGIVLIPTLSAVSPTLGIIGLIIATILAGVPSMLWVLHWIWKHHKARADFRSSAKILAASAIAASAAYLLTALLSTANWVKLVIGLIIFLAVYILGAPLIGAVNTTDINSLRAMLSDMGAVSRIMSLPLKVAETAARVRAGKKKAAEKP